MPPSLPCTWGVEPSKGLICRLTGTSIKPKSHGNPCSWDQGVSGRLGVLPGSSWCLLENKTCSEWATCLHPQHCMGSSLHAPQSMARSLGTAQTSPVGSWTVGCPLTNLQMGEISFFFLHLCSDFSQETFKTDFPWFAIRGFTSVHNIFEIWGRNRVCTLSGWKLWISNSYLYKCWTIKFIKNL